MLIGTRMKVECVLQTTVGVFYTKFSRQSTAEETVAEDFFTKMLISIARFTFAASGDVFIRMARSVG